MFTPGFRLFFGFAVAGFIAAIVYGVATGDTSGANYLGVVDKNAWKGVISLGWQGGVGDHAGYLILMLFALVSAFIGLLLVAFRDADPESVAELSPTGEIPPAQPQTATNYWPAAAAVGAGTVLVGLVTHPGIFVLGLVILVVVAFEWMVSAWADRATGDAEANRQLRQRIMFPVELPVVAIGGVAVAALGMSRIFLAVSEDAAVWVAAGIAAGVFVIAILLATLPRVGRPLIAGLLLLGAIGIITGGIVSAAIGARDIEEHHHEEQTVDGVGEALVGEPSS